MHKTFVLTAVVYVLVGLGNGFAQGNLETRLPSVSPLNDTLRFMGTVGVADSFSIRRDSVFATTRSLTIAAHALGGQQPLPTLHAVNTDVLWTTEPLSVDIWTWEPEDTVRLYDGRALFSGKLHVTDGKMEGNGNLFLGDIAVKSIAFVFLADSWQAKDARFTILNPNPEKPLYPLVLAQNAEINYSMADQKAEVVAGPKWGFIFMAQQWRTSLLKGNYDGNTQQMEFSCHVPKRFGECLPMNNPFYDSLELVLGQIRYHIPEQRMELAHVMQFYFADSKIVPAEERLEILSSGQLATVSNATIYADQRTQYHKFVNAEIQFPGKTYSAQADYDYFPYVRTGQRIPFSLNMQGDTMTVGQAEVVDENFHLNEGMCFKGKVEMESKKKYLHVKGVAKVALSHPVFTNQWYPFEGDANPDSLILPLPQEAMDQVRYARGVYFHPPTDSFYSSFLQPVKSAEDKAIATASGGIMYVPETAEFRIGPVANLQGKDYRGTTCSFQPKDITITTVGKLDLPVHFREKTIHMAWAGEWREELLTGDIETDLVGIFDFDCIPKAAWERLADKFQVASALNNTVDWNNAALREGLAEFLDPKPTQKNKNMQAFLFQVEKSMSYPDVRLAEVLTNSLVLSGMEFRYDPEFHAFWLHSKVGILGIQGEVINKDAENSSKIEYILGESAQSGVHTSDTLRMYLEVDYENWVFFEFYDDVLRTGSSDLDGYNAVIRKSSKRKGYRCEWVDENAKDAFLLRFVNRYIWRTGRITPPRG